MSDPGLSLYIPILLTESIIVSQIIQSLHNTVYLFIIFKLNHSAIVSAYFGKAASVSVNKFP